MTHFVGTLGPPDWNHCRYCHKPVELHEPITLCCPKKETRTDTMNPNPNTPDPVERIREELNNLMAQRNQTIRLIMEAENAIATFDAEREELTRRINDALRRKHELEKEV